MEQWLAIEAGKTRACAAWSKAFQRLAGASVEVLQKQTLKLSGQTGSNTVVAAVETPLSTMRIVFKIASFAHFSTSRLMLHIKFDMAINGGPVILSVCEAQKAHPAIAILRKNRHY